MLTQTGNIAVVYVAPVGIPDPAAPDGVRVEEQLSVTLKASSDEKEYQFNLPIAEKTPALKQLEEWQAQGQLVTIFASSVRALPFVHDTSKDEQGNPLKRYQRAGRKVAVGANLTIEADAFVVFQGYDLRLAGSVDHAQEAQKAHGEFLKRQAEYRRRSIQARIEKAKERIKQQQEAAKTAQAAQYVAPRGVDLDGKGSRYIVEFDLTTGLDAAGLVDALEEGPPDSGTARRVDSDTQNLLCISFIPPMGRNG